MSCLGKRAGPCRTAVGPTVTGGSPSRPSEAWGSLQVQQRFDPVSLSPSEPARAREMARAAGRAAAAPRGPVAGPHRRRRRRPARRIRPGGLVGGGAGEARGGGYAFTPRR